MGLIKYNDFEFSAVHYSGGAHHEENARSWQDITQQGERLIAVNGYIRTSCTGAMREALDEITEGAREEFGKLYLGSNDRYLNVVRKEPLVSTESYEPWPPYETAWAVRFQAEDPFFYADVETNITVQYTGKFDVAVEGNAEVYAYIRIGFSGVPAGGIEIRNNTTGKSLDYTREIEDKDVLEIDMQENTITKNGIPDILEAEEGGYFALMPGNNEIELICSPAQCDLTLSFRNRWK